MMLRAVFSGLLVLSASARGETRAGENDVETGATCGGGDLPRGHMQPFGSHRPASATMAELAEQEAKVLSPRNFWDKFASPLNAKGYASPVILRGLAKGWACYEKWTDDYLIDKYGNDNFIVENTKRENHSTGTVDVPLREFLGSQRYMESEKYVVNHRWSLDLEVEVPWPNHLRCGQWQVADRLFWLSGGDTISSFHEDLQDNIHCLMDGQKEFRVVEQNLNAQIEKPEYGYDMQYDNRPSFLIGFNSSHMDLIGQPLWRQVEWISGTLHPGDCLYLPAHMYHVVVTPPKMRQVAYNIWYILGSDPQKFDEDRCLDELQTTLADMPMPLDRRPEREKERKRRMAARRKLHKKK